MSYWVYMLRCRDGSLYTGSTTDVERRCALHNAGKGAKYTRSHGPVEVVYREACRPVRGAAPGGRHQAPDPVGKTGAVPLR